MYRKKDFYPKSDDPNDPSNIRAYIPYDSQDGLPSGVINQLEIASRPDDFKQVPFNGTYVWKEIRPKSTPA